MSISDNDIPRRQLTIESTKQLSDIMKAVITKMLKSSCPCHYPRFRYIINFQHTNYCAGPVFCADANYLVSAACNNSEYLVEKERITNGVIGDYGADYVYTCKKCGTLYKNIAKQYSINFEYEYMDIIEPKYGTDIGANVIFPFPLLQGLFGFDNSEILKCAKHFKLGNSNEVFDYLTLRHS